MLAARRVVPWCCTLLVALALTAPGSAGAAIEIRHPCGSGTDATELVTRAGPGTRCRTALATMRAWRRAGNPSRFRGHRCGRVKGFTVDFTDSPRRRAAGSRRGRSAGGAARSTASGPRTEAGRRSTALGAENAPIPRAALDLEQLRLCRGTGRRTTCNGSGQASIDQPGVLSLLQGHEALQLVRPKRHGPAPF